MSKKLFASFTVALALAATASVALADQQPLAAQKAIAVADRRGNDTDVLDAQRAGGRAGTLTLSAPRRGRAAELAIVTSDPRLDLRRIMVTYANGQSAMLRGAGAGAIALPAHGRIVSIKVSYVNRGARGAVISLVARGNDRGHGRGHGRDGDGRGHGRDGDDRFDGHGRDGDDRFDGHGRDGDDRFDGRGNDRGHGRDGDDRFDGRGGR